MPAFQAINVEPEENLDDEIDNTRQIHIDEALKRFQTALKLHAQGPRFFDEATDAYDDLFKSDIFQYPEAATEYERAELPASQLAVEASFAAGIDIQSGEVDGADSTLPQALFLAHKNHGQFLLDRIKHTARRTAVPPKAFFQQDDVKEQAQKALLDFNAALDRDPSDAELWRRIARVAGYLNSGRIRRYCLEAAIELDDDPTVEEVEPPSLAEGLAGEELKEHLQVLSDDMGLSHPILGPWVKHDMPALIKRHLDPIPFLPNPTKSLEATRSILTVSESKISIRCPTAAWSELGMALVQLVAEVGFTGKGITIDLPNSEPDEEAMDITDAIQKQLNEEVSSAAVDVGLPDAMDVSDSATKTEAADERAAADGLKPRSEAASAPARKRSQSVAGLAEAGEDENAGEKRSKRIRRRETAGAGEVVNSSALHATQLAQYQAVDQHLFQKTKDVLENIGVTDQSVLDRIGEILELCTSEDRSDKLTSQATIDLKSTITSFNADNAKILINKKETDTLGMSAFLEHAKGGNQKVSASPAFRESHGLGSFAKRLNAGWTTVQDMAWEWLKTIAPSYVEYKWSDMMKAAVVHVISRFDQDIYEMAKYEIEAAAQSKQELMRIHNLVEMLFELHLDIYERITNPNSAVEYSIRVEAKGRLARWLAFASELFQACLDPRSDLAARFLWAAVFSTTLTDNVSREYILQCWTSLRDFLTDEGVEALFLQNNAVLTEISSPAADREISKLTTMDFFLGLFQDDISDPVAIIDNLEPVLNADSVYVPRSDSDGEAISGKNKRIPIRDCASQGLQDLWKFLRAIEMVVADFEGDLYLKNPNDTRPVLLLRMMKSLDELLIRALSLALNEQSAYDIVDEDHLKATAAALAKLSCMLHVSASLEDEIRIGMTQAPSGGSVFQAFMNKLREIQYLAAIHNVLGPRKSCKASNKIFLKMMRMELLKLKNIDNWEDYLGQVLYDLHGLKLGVGIWEVQDHGCPPEKLERRNTIQLADKITVLARRMPMKDLLKSELKTTIEHMQGAIGPVRSTPQMVHNLRNYTEYFKRPVHPLRLYQALKGGVELDTVSVNAPETVLANHGWFFLLGSIALSKYKLVDLSKRQTPGAMDDLRIGATFLRHQLQFTPNNWEGWFRLAECFDYEVEDAVVWSADKMNKDRAELVKFQRNSIHCHTLALSKSVGADTDYEEGDPLHDLYHNFAMRLYASSREPFAMEPFQHSNHERTFIENTGMGTFQRVLHNQMQDYKVWKYAAGLFHKAMRRKPYENLSATDRATKPTVDRVIKALEHAIDVASAVPKTRNSDPILEPHYKILSIAQKLVTRGDLSSQQATIILARQPFGIRAETDDGDTSEDTEDWEEYVIRSLRHLRDKDKSNWQHRMIVRHARLLFDDSAQSNADYVQAKAAFNVLRESMFTKTMVMNVWKCEAERPGRHHVFTEQYVRLMVKILVVMSDRISLEALLRRIRKKGTEFYHFADLWQTCCHSYLALLRQSHKVRPIEEDKFKLVATEDFEIMADRLAEWAGEFAGDLPVLQCMKEAIELKKLNGGLMKAGAIDEVINDCYTYLYLEIGPTLPGPSPSEVLEARARARAREEAQNDASNSLKPQSTLTNILNPPGSQEANGDGEKQAEALPRKKVGIRRPDILRRAEQVYTRAMEAPKSAGLASKSRLGSISSGKRGSNTPNGGEAASPASDGSDMDEPVGDDTEMKDEPTIDEGDDPDATAQMTAASSPRGSIHDSADDESDLSDVPEGWDEEPPPSMLFHDMKAEDGHHSSDEDADEADEEGDEEQEDEQEDETMGGVDADVEDETMEAHEEDETLAAHEDETLGDHEDETLGDHEDETLEGHENDETMEGHEEDETIGGLEEDDEEAEEEEEEEDEEEAEEGDEAEEAEEGDEAEEDEEAEEEGEDEAEEAGEDGEEEDEEEEEEEEDSREVSDEDEEGSEAVETDG
ncbi:conserved hypothetical protein [Verticillium alfalfae VaMs.102]|uniref:Histone transcription regulator 3 homolog n=1 Tax=Verticillium alfalfae (strain VaMs.102 / ATCC MYA-4576 / FGSC 10136) TaxID=526221 RepID=C9S881_VERA1|nr:conserved hypothetical protein [Verticillium alfalfae VaMs.102]EEY15331.1 conserved hypothetical protein [Verticillium alfalfae VaMs.102]